MIIHYLYAYTLMVLGFVIFAGCIRFQKWGYRSAAALCLAIVSVMMAVSFCLQVAFLLQIPELSYFLETGLIIWATWELYRADADLLQRMPTAVARLLRRVPQVSVVLVAWVYLGVQAILLPPSNWDGMTYNLARVLLFAQQRTLFLTHITTIRQAIFPMGSDILAYIWLRLGLDYGLGVFSWLSYTAIILGVYALGRQMTPRLPALTGALVVAGLPELVYQATTVKNDVVMSAVAVGCLVVLAKILEGDRSDKFHPSHYMVHLALLFAFGVSAKLNFGYFAIPFIPCALYLLLRQYPLRTLLPKPKHILPAIPIILVLSQIWLFAENERNRGGWFGSPDFMTAHRHQDGLHGAGANLLRYLLQSLHPTEFLDFYIEQWSGQSIATRLQHFHDDQLADQISHLGFSKLNPHVFGMNWLPHEDFSWFGPLSVIIILPALLFVLLGRDNLVRAISLISWTYLFLLALFVAWMPWNTRFFTLFFVMGAICIAPMINKWPKILHATIQIIAILTLLFATISNQRKPLFVEFSLDETKRYQTFPLNIWEETDYGRVRDFYVTDRFRDDRLNRFIDEIPQGATLALRNGDEAWVYPFMQNRRDLTYFPLMTPSIEDPIIRFADHVDEIDYLFCLEWNCKEEVKWFPNTVFLDYYFGVVYEIE